jgi:predicted SprT family Zn-dependent metalloprotease
MNDIVVPSTAKAIMEVMENKMIEVLAVFERHYQIPLPIPQIRIKPKLGCKFGCADYRDNSITLNQDLCIPKYWNEMVNDTLPHEVAHIVAAKVFIAKGHSVFYDSKRGRGHGSMWKECMRVLGLKPNRCGDIDDETTEKITQRKVSRKYVYGCGCNGREHVLTSILHNRITAGRNRTCRLCKTRIFYKGQKMNA